MHPAIGVGQLRVCTTDTNLAGHMMLPAGTVLWMPHHAIQNSHLNWDKPDSFVPGQWRLCACCASAGPSGLVLSEMCLEVLLSLSVVVCCRAL